MPYYPPDQRRRAFSQDPRRGAVPPAFRRNFGPPYEMRRPDRYSIYHEPPQGYFRQEPRRFPENLNTMMNHAGRLYEGVNIVRQIGAFFNLFR